MNKVFFTLSTLAITANAFAQGGGSVSAGGGAAAPAAGGGAPGAAGGGMTTLIMLGGMFLFMWFFIIRPQRKRQKEHDTFLKGLSVNTEVITSSGLIGTVVDIKDTVVTLDLGNSKVRVLKSYISGELKAGDTPTAQPVAN